MRRSKMDDGRWMMWLFAALFTMSCSLFTSCKTEDDKVVIQTQHQWVEKKVAVVYPDRSAVTKHQLERTAQWFLENFQQAQLFGDDCVRLHLKWYSESTADMTALSEKLANDTSIVAVIGTFYSHTLEPLAEACQKTEKPLIAPTATSEEIIRRYAVPTQNGQSDVRPFLWSLTESDVAFSEIILSAYAAMQAGNLWQDNVYTTVFSPDNVYGRTFHNWMPFQAVNLSIALGSNQLYASTEDLVRRMRQQMESSADSSSDTRKENFCIIEELEQLCRLTQVRREVLVGKLGLSEAYGLPDGTPADDPAYDASARAFADDHFKTWFALSNFGQEHIDALPERQRKLLDYYQGFMPYSDPTTGFEQSYEVKYGVKPTFEECKFYDALMLTAFAAYYQLHTGAAEAADPLQRNADFNKAIYDITFPNTNSALSASVWNPVAMQLYLRSVSSGQLIKFRGASGTIGFDDETCTAATGTTYVHWQIIDGRLLFRNYFSSEGNHRVGQATAAWKYIYDEYAALELLARQAKDEEVNISYKPLTGQYAVVVHASNGFYNYRHLADALNIYQHLRRGGLDDDHIILIADRSIADSDKNPEPGVVRTSPGGPDLMQGVKIDYDAAKLTPADVAHILLGQASDHLPQVLPPGDGHNVMLYWSGHGHSQANEGADEFAWRDLPVGQGFTRELMVQTVRQMQQSAAFRKLLVVAEPCYAEAVVRGIEGTPGVLAMTGANAAEQSWADHWNRKGNFWMSDRFTSNLTTAVLARPDITYRDLYLYCAQHTLGSHACIINAHNFGNLYHSGPEEFVRKQD